MRALALLGTATLLLVGCSLNTDYFSDYRGKNILGNSGFGVGGWALLSDATLKSTYPGTYSPTDYMTWEAVGSGANDGSLTSAYTRGPDGVSPAWRLEVKNLLPDGDFEAESPVTYQTGANNLPNAYWSVGPGATPPYNWGIAASGTGNINHNTLEFGSAGTGDILTLNLQSAVAPTLWLRLGVYRFRMQYFNALSGPSLVVAFSGADQTTSDKSGDWSQSNVIINSGGINSLSQAFTKSPGNNADSIIIGNSGVGTLIYMDDARLFFTSIDPYVKLALPSLSSGALTLLPGTKSGAYIFTFYVRDDPTANESSGIHLLNRLNPSGVTVAFRAAQKSGSTTPPPFFTPRPSSGWPNWTQISVPLGFDFVDTDSQIPSGTDALDIEFAPTGTNITANQDVGSLLLAQPVLLYNP